jgi:hypothetical protein
MVVDGTDVEVDWLSLQLDAWCFVYLESAIPVSNLRFRLFSQTETSLRRRLRQLSPGALKGSVGEVSRCRDVPTPTPAQTTL